jgi:hypothetical protein
MSRPKPSWSFKESSVGQSFAWSLALSLLPVVAAFVSSWIIARFSGPTVWGTVSWAMAFATQLLIVAKVGIELGASKLASEYGVSKPGVLRDLLRIASNLRLAFTLPTALLTYFFAPQIAELLHDASLTGAVRISAAIIFCASIYEFQEQFLVGLNRHATVSRVRAMMLSLRLVSTVAVVAIGLGAVAILVGYVAAWLVGIAAFSLLLRRYLPKISEGHSEHGPIRRRLLAMTIPLAVSSASVAVYTQVDKLVLGYFDNVEEVGQYSIARRDARSLFPPLALVTTFVLHSALRARRALELAPREALAPAHADCGRVLRLGVPGAVGAARGAGVLDEVPLRRRIDDVVRVGDRDPEPGCDGAPGTPRRRPDQDLRLAHGRGGGPELCAEPGAHPAHALAGRDPGNHRVLRAPAGDGAPGGVRGFQCAPARPGGWPGNSHASCRSARGRRYLVGNSPT